MNNLLQHDPAALESNARRASDTAISDDFEGSEIASPTYPTAIRKIAEWSVDYEIQLVRSSS